MSASDKSVAATVRGRRWRSLGGSTLILVAASALLWAVWDWNWFRPLVEAQLSAAMGRAITIDRLEVPSRARECHLRLWSEGRKSVRIRRVWLGHREPGQCDGRG